MIEYTFLSLFCGLGGGSLGVQQARAHLFGHDARFRSLGGIDNNPDACADFEYLTKSPALCTDIAKMTPGALREFAGPRAPDMLLDSAPCTAHSALTNPELAQTPKYQEMAQLYVTGVELALSTWDVPPRLIMKENVPRILSIGAKLVGQVVSMMERADYAVDISTHDCGELGGGAQHRRRALLVGRLKSRVYGFLYKPPKQRVQGCGEVLGTLPLPETPSAGPMHRMPRVGWTTWVRLALIPARGDHRDLPGALERLQKRREAWGRMHVEGWTDPSITVAGDGSNGAYGVADPRVEVSTTYANNHAVEGWEDPAHAVTGGSRPVAGGPSVADPRASTWHPYGVKGWSDPSGAVTGHGRPGGGPFSVADPRASGFVGAGAFGVKDWTDPSATVTGEGCPSNGPFSVADPRVVTQPGNDDTHWNKHRVTDWTQPAGAVVGATRPGSGAPSVADPRASRWKATDGRFSSLGVFHWTDPTGVITSGGRPSRGAFSVADVRVKRSPGRNPDHHHYVLPWADPSFTIAGQANPGTGAYSVADPRILDGIEGDVPLGCEPRAGAYGMLDWTEAAKTITASGCVDNGPFAIADVRPPTVQPLAFIDGAKRSPFVVVDGRRVDVPVVIIAEDGTWHRPMTPLELALLQGLPATVDGAPLKLFGDNVGKWVTRIGNMIPVGTGKAYGAQALMTLLSSDYGAGMATTGGVVWVDRADATVAT